MKHPVLTIYTIERAALSRQSALFLNKTDFCSFFLSLQSRGDCQGQIPFCLLNKLNNLQIANDMKIERINDWFARRGKWMIQRRWLVLSLSILVFAIGLQG